jgi:release factor glutamine methyltransferase
VRTNVCSWGKSGRATDITAKTRFDPSATSKDAIGASPAERSDASLSFHIGRASVVALDINPNAAKVTAENAHANGLGKPIIAVGSNLLSALSPRPLFDVILSSPPSFAGEPLDVADRAWHAGPSYRDIAMLFIQARERLTSGGCMYVLFSTESDLDLLGNLISRAGFAARLVAERSILIESMIIYELRVQ